MPRPDKASRDWYRVVDKADSVELYIYGDISAWPWEELGEVNAKGIVDALAAAKGKPVDLHINSGGGDVFEAFAIYTALKNHDAPVTAHVDGLAASAASLVMVAASRIVMADVAWVMVHNPYGHAFGNAEEMRRSADLLESIAGTFRSAYAARNPDMDWAAAMDAETWFDAHAALDAGLCDEVVGGLAAAAKVETSDMATIAGAPEAVRAMLADTAAGDAAAIIAEAEAATDAGSDPVPGAVQERRAVLLGDRVRFIQR